MSKTMIQVTLMYYEEGAGRGDAQLTTWVEKDPRIVKGATVILKDDPREWTVHQVWATTEVPFDELQSNRNWDNNNYDKHDGTSMKKRVKS